MIYNITENKKKSFSQDFFDKYKIISRSGLHKTEAVLIEHLKENKNPKNILILENRTGAVAFVVKNIFPDAKITVQNIDLFYSNKIKRNFYKNNLYNIEVNTAPFVKEDNYDLILIQVAGQIYKEFILDLIQDSYQHLLKNGKLFISAEAKLIWLHKKLVNSLPSFSLYKNKETQLFIIKHKNELKKNRNFEFNFNFSIPNHSISMSSIPGTFAHGRVDEGALAIIDLVNLKEKQRILDLGCGIGSIGIALKFREPSVNVDFLDSNSRAIYSCKKNCELNGISDSKFILASDEQLLESQYDIVVANPPYFTNYKIAELFIKNAKNSLKKDGKFYLVSKNISVLEEIFKKYFKAIDLLNRRGYFVIVGEL